MTVPALASRIKILHVVDNLGKGGLENGLANVICGLEPDRYEHTVFVIRHLGKIADRLHGLARIVHMDKKPGDSRFQAPDILRAVRSVRPHIVHSRNWGAIEAVCVARLLLKPAVVHSEHGLDAAGSASESFQRRWFRSLSYQLCDQVFAVSRQLAEFHALRTGLAARHIGVIHNGVDMRRFKANAESRAKVRSELGFASDEFCIVAVGNLTPVKDHMTLLRAIDTFHMSARRPWRLVVYGCGSEEEKLEQFVRCHPDWAGRVRFPGLTDRVPELLTAFDAYVLTSLTEGICNSLLEAMSTGLPVIATNTGGNPEVVTDGVSGILFGVGDDRALATHLLSLIDQPGLSSRLAHGALARVNESFSVDGMVRNYDHLYRSVLDSRRIMPLGLRAVGGA